MGAADWEGQIIGNVEIKGAPDASLLQTAGLVIGTPYQTRTLREAIERLYKTGKVRSVAVEITPFFGNTITVTFVVSEKRAIAAISSSGQNNFSEAEIHAALGFTPGKTVDEATWNERLSALRSLYHREGYFHVEFESQFQPLLSDPLKVEVFLKIKEGNRARIKKIAFTGNRFFSDLVLNLLVQSKPPEYFSTKRLEDDVARLRAFYKKRGYPMARFGPPKIDFLPETNEIGLTLPVSASTRIDLFFHAPPGAFPFKLPDLPTLPPLLTTLPDLPDLPPLLTLPRFGPPGIEQLEQFVQISEERGDDRTVLEEAAREIEAFYHAQGYPFVTIRVETKPVPDEGRTEVHFTIDHVVRARIRAIVFEGNTAFPPKRLRKLIKLKQEGIFTKTRFTKEQLQDDRNNLIAFYEREGFQNARITPDIRFDQEKKWATLTFHIEEGAQTRIGSLAMKGIDRLTEEHLKEAISLRPNNPYNKGVVREGARQILTAYSRQGYIDARVDSDVTFSEDQTRANIQYQVIEGDQVFLGSLSLKGNIKTKDEFLLREMMIQIGDPYDYEKILKSQQRLSQTGLFGGIRFDPARNPNDPRRQDMTLTVVERPRMALEVGPGYLDEVGVRGTLELSHRNLFGTGRKVSARAEGSPVEQKYSLNYKEPRIFSYDIDATLGTTYFFTERASFDEETFLGTIGIEKKLSPKLKGALSYQYETTETSNVRSETRLTANDEGRLVIGSINPSLIHDTRDDPFHPKTGTIHGITLRNAAQVFGSNVQFVKMSYQGSTFRSPTARITLAFSTRVGVARQFGETTIIPLRERFFLGGRSTVRGYRQDQLGIEGETRINGRSTGGNAMLIFNEELRLSVIKSFGMVFFMDHGNVWSELDDITFGEMKSTIGIGLRYNTPVGPFRLDQGYKLDREDGESASELHFTLGHTF